MRARADVATCRGCRTVLVDAFGKPARPWYTGNQNAYHPDTKRAAKSCYYGGFVCRQSCDLRACLELERDMPGHGGAQTVVSSEVRRMSNQKWGQS